MSDALWKHYEPEPPLCSAIVMTDFNFDEVCACFTGYDTQPRELLSSSKHVNVRGGERSLVLTFQDEDGKPYELTLRPWQVLVRQRETPAFSVVDFNEFRFQWRERLSPL